jgi:ribose transport system substrate-binding protein
MAALAAATILGLAGVASAENGKNLLWVQPMRDHPVHRLMQQGFLDKCKELGYTCEIVAIERHQLGSPAPCRSPGGARTQFDAIGV